MSLEVNKKIFIVFLLCICIVPLCSSCDFLYRMLHKEGAEERDLIGEVMPFEGNPRVEEIQRLLNLYGYGVGTVDGRLGPHTREAIGRFQKDNDIEPSKFVDYATWDTLTLFSESGLVVNGEIDNRTVQRALKNAGFSPGKIDGKRGPRTEMALRKFQKAMGLQDDGMIGFKTLLELGYFLPPTEE